MITPAKLSANCPGTELSLCISSVAIARPGVLVVLQGIEVYVVGSSGLLMRMNPLSTIQTSKSSPFSSTVG